MHTQGARLANFEGAAIMSSLIIRDDFNDPQYTRAQWGMEGPPELTGRTVRFRVRRPTRGGQPNGDILCLGPGGGGRGPASAGETSGHFRCVFNVDGLDLRAGAFTAFRLFDKARGVAIARFEIAKPAPRDRLREGRFELRFAALGGSGEVSKSLSARGSRPGPITLEMGWQTSSRLESSGGGHLRAVISNADRSREIVLDGLANGHLSYDTLELGLLRIAGDGPAGYFEIDEFEAWRFGPARD